MCRRCQEVAIFHLVEHGEVMGVGWGGEWETLPMPTPDQEGISFDVHPVMVCPSKTCINLECVIYSEKYNRCTTCDVFTNHQNGRTTDTTKPTQKLLNVNCRSVSDKKGQFQHLIDSTVPDIVKTRTRGWRNRWARPIQCWLYHTQARQTR